jgi:hypothetical protein
MMGDGETADDAFEAATEAQQLASARDGALGEDAYQVTPLQVPSGGSQRFHHLPRRIGLGDWDDFHRPYQPADAQGFVEMAVHHEANPTPRAGADEEGIDQGNVTADQQSRPALRKVFQATHL